MLLMLNREDCCAGAVWAETKATETTARKITTQSDRICTSGTSADCNPSEFRRSRRLKVSSRLCAAEVKSSFSARTRAARRRRARECPYSANTNEQPQEQL